MPSDVRSVEKKRNKIQWNIIAYKIGNTIKLDTSFPFYQISNNYTKKKIYIYRLLLRD